MRAREFIEYQTPTPLFEALDNPYPISQDTELAKKISEMIRSKYEIKITGLNVYERTDVESDDHHRDIFIVFRYKGLWEVHHANYDIPRKPVSGVTLNLKSGPNPRFMSTILNLYKVRAPRGIRIVASPVMLKSYLSILSRYLNRTGLKYDVSEIDDNYVGLDGETASAVTIKPSGTSWVQSLSVTKDES